MVPPKANGMLRLRRLSKEVSASGPPPKQSERTHSGVEAEKGNVTARKFDVLQVMDFDNMLTHEERKIRRKVQKIMQANVKEIVVDLYECAEFDSQIVEICKRFGPAGLQIQGYGCPGFTHTQAVLFALEMARVDVSFATFYLVHCGLAMQSIAVAGSEEQKTFWLPQMSRLEKIGSFALTEPEHGSDATNLSTTARKTGDGWILNGRKRWIGNGTFADVNVVWAKDVSSGQIYGFLVSYEHYSRSCRRIGWSAEDSYRVFSFCMERHFPGLRTQKIERKTALRIVQNADIFLEDCFVPASHRLEKEGFGASTKRVLESSRALVAALCAGALLGACESAFAYCMRRKQFNRELAGFQLVQERLMRALGLVQASLLLVLRLGRLLEEEKASMGLIALMKGTCSRLAREGVALCREVQGGNGIVTDFGVAKFHADIEALYTYEGTYDINMLVAAREFTGRNAIV